MNMGCRVTRIAFDVAQWRSATHEGASPYFGALDYLKFQAQWTWAM